MKKTLLCCIAIFILCNVYGQFDQAKIQKDFYTKYCLDVINRSEFVFEGAIVKKSSYTRNGKCIVSNIVRIKNVLRGNLKPGTIEVLNYAEACEPGRYTVDLKMLTVDTVGFFFCKVENEFGYDKKYNIDKVDNTTVLSTYKKDTDKDLDWIYVMVHSMRHYKGLNRLFLNRNEVYKYLKSFPNISLPPDFIDDGQPPLKPVNEFTRQYLDSIRESTTDKKKMTSLKSAATSTVDPVPEIFSITTDDGFDFVTGRGQIITITGLGFGDGRAGAISYEGFLSFTNADDGGKGPMLINDVDAYDYQINYDNSESWTDTQIKFRLPHRIFENNQNIPGQQTIGSGYIAVTNRWLMRSDGYPITINSSFMEVKTTDGKKHVAYLKDGCLSFSLGSRITDQQRVLIQRAVDEWACRLNVDLKIVPNSSNIIDFVSGQTPIMVTIPKWESISNFRLLTGSDIHISDSPTWDYALPDNIISSGKLDFYNTILHELGHALLLGHIIDWVPQKNGNGNFFPDDYGHTLMYFAIATNPGASRTDLRNSLNDEYNANYIVLRSIGNGFFNYTLNPINCPGAPNAPTNAIASVNDAGAVTVSWTSTDAKVDHFEVERSIKSKGNYLKCTSVDSKTYSYTDNSTTKNIYYYRIKAVNSTNSSSYCYVSINTTGITPNSCGDGVCDPTVGENATACKDCLPKLNISNGFYINDRNDDINYICPNTFIKLNLKQFYPVNGGPYYGERLLIDVQDPGDLYPRVWMSVFSNCDDNYNCQQENGGLVSLRGFFDPTVLACEYMIPGGIPGVIFENGKKYLIKMGMYTSYTGGIGSGWVENTKRVQILPADNNLDLSGTLSNPSYAVQNTITLANSTIAAGSDTKLTAGYSIVFNPGSVINYNVSASITPYASTCNNLKSAPDTSKLGILSEPFSLVGQNSSTNDKIEKQKATFSKIEIFPNPTNGNFTVRVPDLEMLKNITILSDLSKTIFKYENVTENEFDIDISAYPSGIYIVRFEYTDYVVIKKIVKL